MKTLRLAAVLALPLLFALPISGPAAAEDPVPSAKDYPAPPAGWQVPRTAWGDPDLRGMWPVDYLQGTPRERPESGPAHGPYSRKRWCRIPSPRVSVRNSER